jgi:hypothetical protein
MAIAPQVYNMRRGGGGFGRMLAGAARGALAAGALAGAGALALAVDDDMKVAKQQKATRRKGKSFLQELQAQGAKEREATEYAQQLMAEDSKAYRGMVRDAGEKVIADLTAEGRPSASSEAAIPSDAQGFRPGAAVSTSTDASVYDDPNVLVEVTPEQRAKAKKFLANRISHQSAVPQADTNVANESTAAQRASLGSPPDPTPVVRQQPSSGQVVSDVSNVAKLDRASMIREADATVTEAKALNRIIRERDQTGYKGDRQLPKDYRGGSKRDLDAGIHAGTYIGMADDMNDPARGGLTASHELMASMLQRGNVLGAQPSQPTSGVVMSSNRELMSEMMQRGNVLPDATAQMSRGDKSYVPTPETAGPFVSEKGKEIGALLSQAQKKKSNPREQQIRSDVDKALGLYTPEQKEAEVQRRLGQ